MNPASLPRRIARRIAGVITWVSLALVYYVVVTPIGIVRRFRGSDPLHRKGKPGWEPIDVRLRDHDTTRMY